jgi:hypothetical protein
MWPECNPLTVAKLACLRSTMATQAPRSRRTWSKSFSTRSWHTLISRAIPRRQSRRHTFPKTRGHFSNTHRAASPRQCRNDILNDTSSFLQARTSKMVTRGTLGSKIVIERRSCPMGTVFSRDVFNNLSFSLHTFSCKWQCFCSRRNCKGSEVRSCVVAEYWTRQRMIRVSWQVRQPPLRSCLTRATG